MRFPLADRKSRLKKTRAVFSIIASCVIQRVFESSAPRRHNVTRVYIYGDKRLKLAINDIRFVYVTIERMKFGKFCLKNRGWISCTKL